MQAFDLHPAPQHHIASSQRLRDRRELQALSIDTYPYSNIIVALASTTRGKTESALFRVMFEKLVVEAFLDAIYPDETQGQPPSFPLLNR